MKGLFLGVLLFFSTSLFAQGEFITVWNTTLGTPSSSIKFTAVGTGYTIAWEDVNDPAITGTQAGNNGTVTVTFPAAGTYRVKMFGGTFSAFNTVIGSISSSSAPQLIEVSQWGTIPWTSFATMFFNCANMDVTATDIPDLSRVTSMRDAFNGCESLVFNPTINNWDTKTVVDMNNLFAYAKLFNQPLNNWNTSSATIMSGIFYAAKAFNQPLDNWNTSSATITAGMFRLASAFNQPIGMWDVSNVKYPSAMFWDASSFNQPLNNWNTQNFIYTDYMFAGATSFNQPLNDWNMSNVINMFDMFGGATSFNQPLDKWNTSKVRGMIAVFISATSFNQSLATWDLRSININNGATPQESIQLILYNSGLDCKNYDATLIGWANNPNTPSGLDMGATSPLVYSSTEAVAARNTLIAKGWKFNGDTYNPTCNTSLPLTFGTISATLKNNLLSVHFETLQEYNNKLFEIEASKDGKRFTKIGSLESKAPTIKNNNTLQYYFSKDLASSAIAWVPALGLLGLGMFRRRKTIILASIGLLAVIFSFTGCSKIQDVTALINKDDQLYIRIKQIDIDGTTSYSKVVKVNIDE